MSISMILYKLTSICIMDMYIYIYFSHLLICSLLYNSSNSSETLSDDGSNSNLVLSPTLTLIYSMHI